MTTSIHFIAAPGAPKAAELRAVGVSSDRMGDGDAPWTHLERTGFTGKAGAVVLLPAPSGDATVAYVGLGLADAVDPAVLRGAAGALGRAARPFATASVELLNAVPASVDAEAALAAVVEGIALGAYRYDALRSDPTPVKLSTVTVVGSALKGGPATAVVARAEAVAAAVALARDLVNEPGGTLTPEAFAKVAEEVAAGSKPLGVTVHDEDAIAALGLGGLLAVNRGSTLPARFLELSYSPPRAKRGTPTVALVGKGITYDSGGLSIKTHDGLTTMKCDMAGAAAVLATFSALDAVKVPVHVKGYIPLTDNMLGGDATRVGDVITHVDGSTTEVLNTDAEGRLVLADALAVATGRSQLSDKPKGRGPAKDADRPAAVVDLATLTGAAMVALGTKVAAVMGNDESFTTRVRAAAEHAGEPVWPLPLRDEERPLLESKVADRKNVAGRYGGAMTAGLFLRDFVADGVPWAHLDIAGPAFNDGADDGHIPSGGTGYGVRTLLELLTTFPT